MAEIQLFTSMAGTQLSSSMAQPQNSNCMVGPQLLNTIVGTQLQLSAIEADNPTVCLHGPQSTPNYGIFKCSGPSLPGMTSFTHKPHFLSGVYYDNCDWYAWYASELRAELFIAQPN